MLRCWGDLTLLRGFNKLLQTQVCFLPLFFRKAIKLSISCVDGPFGQLPYESLPGCLDRGPGGAYTQAAVVWGGCCLPHSSQGGGRGRLSSLFPTVKVVPCYASCGEGFEVLKPEVLCGSLAEVAVGPGSASGLVHISVPLPSVLCPGLSLLVGKQVSHTHP